MEVLRINDFLAVIVADTKDYMNNGLYSTTTSSININTNIYLGGVPSMWTGPPFSTSDIAVCTILPLCHSWTSPLFVLSILSFKYD